MKKLKRSNAEKGITLIALIITVVVLMTLATVAITSIQNDGIISHAQNAVDEFGDKQAEEQSFLNNYLAQLEEELGGGGNLISAEDIKNKPMQYYGKKVTNYGIDVHSNENNPNTPNNWLIFHVDDSNNIYLISDAYATSAKVPNGKNGTAITNVTSYRFKLDTVYKNYTNSDDITDRTWLGQYYEFLNGSTSANTNIRATAYVMDKTQWTNHLITNNADLSSEEKTRLAGITNYIVGAPTLELYAESYNTTHAGENENRIYTQVENTYGYTIKISTTQDGTDTGARVNNPEGMDKLYFISDDTDNAWNTCLAGPDKSTQFMKSVGSLGNLGGASLSNYQTGFRPLVCLASGVQLELNEDGETYSIK